MITNNLKQKFQQHLRRFCKVITLLVVVALCALVLPHPAGATSSSNSKNSSSSNSKNSSNSNSKSSSSSNSKSSSSSNSKSSSNSNDKNSKSSSSSQSKSSNSKDKDDNHGGKSGGSSNYNGNGHNDDDDYDHHGGPNDGDYHGGHDANDERHDGHHLGNDCGDDDGGSGGVLLVLPNILNTTAGQLVVPVGNSFTLVGQLIAGSQPVTYQWMKRDTTGDYIGSFTAIPGATSLVLNITNTTDADSGVYWIIATNAMGSMLSAESNVIVASSLAVQNNTGTNLQILPGENGTLFAELIAGSAPVTYQWFKSRPGSTPGSVVVTSVPDATSLTYTITNAQDTDTGRYWIVATNASGSAVSTGTQVQVSEVNE